MRILRTCIGGAAIALAAMTAGTAAAVELTGWTVDSGGGPLSGGGWTLAGTFGQPDAGALTGGAYTLRGGFWFGGLAASAVDPDSTDQGIGSAAAVQPAVCPNPANPVATIAFTLPARAYVRVSVLDLRGTLVATLLEDERPAGEHRVSWDGRDQHGLQAASGVYIVLVEAGGVRATARVTLLR
ncbi:MAG: hypothetical protein IPJ24_05880 [bacterium]|nr:hypothetical protein [bacterium]